jgi:hypothetical protein
MPLDEIGSASRACKNSPCIWIEEVFLDNGYRFQLWLRRSYNLLITIVCMIQRRIHRPIVWTNNINHKFY